MGKRLENKICAITGAASGIGREIALAFAKEGATPVILDINRKDGEAILMEIQSQYGPAGYVCCDITREQAVESAFQEIVQKYGRVDVLVNNTGIFQYGTITDMPFADFQKIMSVNVSGMYLCMQKCIEQMLKTGGGNIINIASEAGLNALKDQTAYNVSKAAVIMLSKSAAVDYAQKHIRVNCICPGRVFTPLVEKVLQESGQYEQELKRLSEDRPMKRMGKPHEIAMGAVYLASDESPYATGAVLSIDGGSTCL